jgi:methionyl aminopeptidase
MSDLVSIAALSLREADAEEPYTTVDASDDDDEGNEDEVADEGATGGEKKKKKKKKPKKKKKASAAIPKEGSLPPQSRLLTGYTDYYVKYGQTPVPSIPVADLFPSGEFPPGEIQPHGLTKHVDATCTKRITREEIRYDDLLLDSDLINKVRHASEVHRQVRHYAQSFIKPGIKLIDMCEMIEETNRRLVRENGLQAGIGFPTGCSVNHVAAHYTPNCGDNTVLEYGDVMKIDFGTQIDGRIIDCAWTVAFDPKFDPVNKRNQKTLFFEISFEQFYPL